MKKIISILMTLVLLLTICACGSPKRQKEYDQWPSYGLGAKLPVPDTEKVLVYEYSTLVSIDIEEQSKEMFDTYVLKCGEAGFDIEPNRSTDRYTAFNKEGDKLELNYYDGMEEISVSLYKSKVDGIIEWPSIGLATLLPTPVSNKGTITTNSSSEFEAYIGEISKDDYTAYVNNCMELGFSVDFDTTEKSFTASNENKVMLQMEYQGFSTMYIHIEAAQNASLESDQESNEEATEPTIDESETSPSSEKSDTDETESDTNETESTEELSSENLLIIREEFKETMDAYEAFMDEYVVFMQEYAVSDGTDYTLLMRYAEILGEYTEMVEKVEEWENKDLNEAELAYYLEVQTRVLEKLAEIEY